MGATPGGSGSGGGGQSQAERMAAKLMQMQLDLDESETGYYESVANELLEQLDRMTEERDGWQGQCADIAAERDRLDAALADATKHHERTATELAAAVERAAQAGAERDEARRQLEFGAPSTATEQQLQQRLAELEAVVREQDRALEAKSQEVAFAEQSLQEIQTLFEQTKKTLPASAVAAGEEARGRARRVGGASPGAGGGDPIPAPSAPSPSADLAFAGPGAGDDARGLEQRTVAELRRVITEHERQLREQRAQLGALQEAADEHEANHALLRQQKKSLKDAAEALRHELSEVEKELAVLRERERDERRRADDLAAALQAEVARGEETAHALGYAEADLQASRAELQRLHATVAEQGITIMRLEGGAATAATTTPTKSPSGAARSRNVPGWAQPW
jgi:septal ring factor EnvC (AmiA/AmiB activator)